MRLGDKRTEEPPTPPGAPKAEAKPTFKRNQEWETPQGSYRVLGMTPEGRVDYEFIPPSGRNRVRSTEDPVDFAHRMERYNEITPKPKAKPPKAQGKKAAPKEETAPPPAAPEAPRKKNGPDAWWNQPRARESADWYDYYLDLWNKGELPEFKQFPTWDAFTNRLNKYYDNPDASPMIAKNFFESLGMKIGTGVGLDVDLPAGERMRAPGEKAAPEAAKPPEPAPKVETKPKAVTPSVERYEEIQREVSALQKSKVYAEDSRDGMMARDRALELQDEALIHRDVAMAKYQAEIDAEKAARKAEEAKLAPQKAAERPYVSSADLAEHYKAQGMDRQAAWKQYVKDTVLSNAVRSDKVDAPAFMAAYDKITPGTERLNEKLETITLPTEAITTAEPPKPAAEGKPSFTRTTPAKDTPERTKLEADYEAGSTKQSAIWDEQRKLETEIAATKYGSKKREALEKKLEKNREQERALSATHEPLRRQSYLADLEDAAAQTENPILQMAAKYGIEEQNLKALQGTPKFDAVRQTKHNENFKTTHDAIRAELRKRVADADAKDTDARTKQQIEELTPEENKKAIESAVRSVATDFMTTPLRADDIDRSLRGALYGERNDVLKSKFWDSLNALAEEYDKVTGRIGGQGTGGRGFRELRTDVDNARKTRAEALEAGRKLIEDAKAEKAKVETDQREAKENLSKSVRPLAEAPTASIAEKGAWQGNVAKGDGIATDGKFMVDTSAIKDSKRAKALAAPSKTIFERYEQANVRKRWNKVEKESTSRLEEVGFVEQRGIGHAVYADKDGKLYSIPAKQARLLQSLVGFDEVRGGKEGRPLALYRDGKMVAAVSAMEKAPDINLKMAREAAKKQAAVTAEPPAPPAPAPTEPPVSAESTSRPVEQTPSAAKEPWQMTKAEYAQFYRDNYKTEQANVGNFPNLAHENFVRQAAEQGKPVPAEVLAEYGIQPKTATPPGGESVTLGGGLGALQPMAEAAAAKAKEVAEESRFIQTVVKPRLEKFAGGSREVYEMMRNVVNPRAAVDSKTLNIIYKLKGGRDELNWLLDQQFQHWHKQFENMTRAEQVGFIDNIRRGRKQLNPDGTPNRDLQDAADFMRSVDNDLWKELNTDGILQSWLDNHYRVMWKEPPTFGRQAKTERGFLGITKRQFMGTKGFAKRHFFDDMTEGLTWTFSRNSEQTIPWAKRSAELGQRLADPKTVGKTRDKIQAEKTELDRRLVEASTVNTKQHVMDALKWVRPQDYKMIEGPHGMTEVIPYSQEAIDALKRVKGPAHMPDIVEKRGGTPAYWNPQTMFQAHYADSMKYLTMRRTWDDLGKMGLRKWVQKGSSAPAGFVRVDDAMVKTYFKAPTSRILSDARKKVEEGTSDSNAEAIAELADETAAKGKDVRIGDIIAQSGEWWVEEGAGRLMNRMVSTDYIRGNIAGRFLLRRQKWVHGNRVGHQSLPLRL